MFRPRRESPRTSGELNPVCRWPTAQARIGWIFSGSIPKFLIASATEWRSTWPCLANWYKAATVMLSAFTIALGKFNMFAKEITERILRIRMPVDRDYDTAFEEPFRKYLDEYRLVSLETVRAGVLQEVVFSVSLKPGTRPGELLEAIRACNDNQKVTLVLGQEEVDL